LVKLITEFKNKKTERVFNVSGKTIIIEFDKIFNNPKLADLNTFVLKKKRAYADQGELTIEHLNYFVKYYDEDNELIMAYLNLKFMIDRKSNYGKKTFIRDLYDYLLSDSMVEKIKKLTDDNYMIDLEAKLGTSEKRRIESLQFTNEHGKVLMNVSTTMKLMIPIITHYMYVNAIGNVDKFILRCFDLIASHFESDDIDIHNKLYETVTSRINQTRHSDRGHWRRVEIEGKDPLDQIDSIMERIYVNIINKYVYDKNVVFFNHASLNNIIIHIRKTKSKYNYMPITNKKDADGLSDFDKIEINNSKFDESSVIIGNINIHQSIEKLRKKYKIEFDDEEVQWYADKVFVRPFQRDLTFQLFARHFGSVRDMYSIKRVEYAKLIVIMKHMLYKKGFRYMQHILSGDVVETVNRRPLNKKQVTKLRASSRYHSVFDEKYSDSMEILDAGNIMHNYLNIMLNSRIRIMDYQLQEHEGKELNISKHPDIIMDEYLRLVELI